MKKRTGIQAHRRSEGLSSVMFRKRFVCLFQPFQQDQACAFSLVSLAILLCRRCSVVEGGENLPTNIVPFTSALEIFDLSLPVISLCQSAIAE